MKRSEKLFTNEQKRIANVVKVLGVSGISTTDDPVEWEVHPERIAEVLQMHSSCIPNAMSGWNETVPLPTTWAIWCINRMTRAKCRLGSVSCGSN